MSLGRIEYSAVGVPSMKRNEETNAKTGDITKQIESLNQTISVISDVVLQLKEKLSPILQQDRPNTGCGGDAKDQSLSPLSLVISSMNDRLNGALYDLENIKQRISI